MNSHLRLSSVVRSHYDPLFKAIITAGQARDTDGEVDSPTGHFALIEIPEYLHELAAMRDEVDPDSSLTNDWPESGWYFATENSDGVITVYKGKHHTVANAFAAARTDYGEWLDRDESDV